MADERSYFQLRDFHKALNADAVKKAKGNPPWIKSYCGQLEDPDYIELTLSERALLHDLRLLAARRGNKILDDEKYLRAQLRYSSRTALVQKLHTLRTRRFTEPFNLATNEAAKAALLSRTTLDEGESDVPTEERRGEKKPPKPPLRGKHICADCGLGFKSERRLEEHHENLGHEQPRLQAVGAA